MRIALALATILGALAGSAAAQAQAAQPATQTPPPTYQQTVDWILSKTNQLGAQWPLGLENTTTSFSNVAIQSCVFSYHVSFSEATHSGNGDGAAYQEIDVSVPMGSGISATSGPGNGGAFVVVLHSTSQSIHLVGNANFTGTFSVLSNRSINFYTDMTLAGTVANGYYTDLAFGTPDSDHQDIATRMTKALNYLAGLCKAPAQKEPF